MSSAQCVVHNQVLEATLDAALAGTVAEAVAWAVPTEEEGAAGATAAEAAAAVLDEGVVGRPRPGTPSSFDFVYKRRRMNSVLDVLATAYKAISTLPPTQGSLEAAVEQAVGRFTVPRISVFTLLMGPNVGLPPFGFSLDNGVVLQEFGYFLLCRIRRAVAGTPGGEELQRHAELLPLREAVTVWWEARSVRILTWPEAQRADVEAFYHVVAKLVCRLLEAPLPEGEPAVMTAASCPRCGVDDKKKTTLTCRASFDELCVVCLRRVLPAPVRAWVLDPALHRHTSPWSTSASECTVATVNPPPLLTADFLLATRQLDVDMCGAMAVALELHPFDIPVAHLDVCLQPPRHRLLGRTGQHCVQQGHAVRELTVATTLIIRQDTGQGHVTW